MLRNSEDAEDAVQEIFIDVWKNAARFDPAQSSETTFIAMIARRRLIDRIRHGQRRISSDSIEDMVVEPADDVGDLLQRVARYRRQLVGLAFQQAGRGMD